MQHTIYFGPNRLLLAAEKPLWTLNPIPDKMALMEGGIDDNAISRMLIQLQKGKTTDAIWIHPNPDEALETVKRHFLFIQAAGGVVWSHQNRILLIFRKGKWDLPKGKLDPGERLEECAVREVEEETGLREITLLQPHCRTYHTYYQDGLHCLKESHWYLMAAAQTAALSPQLEEDIEQCIWAAPEEMDQYLANTHPSIADVIQSAIPKLVQNH